MEKVWYEKLSGEAKKVVMQHIDYHNLEDAKELKIFDFGCGNGRYLYFFRELFPKAQLFGADIEVDNIGELEKNFENVFVLNSGKMDLDFNDNFFDLVFSSNVLEHIPRPLYAKYIAKIFKIIKPGGRFVFGTPNYPYKRLYDIKKALYALLKGNLQNFRYYLFDDPTHVNPLNYNKLKNDLSMFSKLELHPTHLFMRKIIKNKKFSDKINGIAYKL